MQHYWTPNITFLLATYGGVPFYPHQCCVSDNKIKVSTGISFCAQSNDSETRPIGRILQIQDPPSSNDEICPEGDQPFLSISPIFHPPNPTYTGFSLQRHLTWCIHSDGSLRITLSRWTYKFKLDPRFQVYPHHQGWPSHLGLLSKTINILQVPPSWPYSCHTSRKDIGMKL